MYLISQFSLLNMVVSNAGERGYKITFFIHLDVLDNFYHL